MGVLIVLAAVGIPFWRKFDRYRARRAATLAQSNNPYHQAQMVRWTKGLGPDPREAMFCNGVQIDTSESPELSSLAWHPTSPRAASPTATRMTGF
jgi:hypothetical protein